LRFKESAGGVRGNQRPRRHEAEGGRDVIRPQYFPVGAEVGRLLLRAALGCCRDRRDLRLSIRADYDNVIASARRGGKENDPLCLTTSAAAYPGGDRMCKIRPLVVLVLALPSLLLLSWD
ncbi:unnamed protein product, partial [Ectocarpus fasciculatus]